MRKQIVAFMTCLIMFLGTSVRAEDPGLLQQIGTKLVRGVANFTTGWVELPKQIYVVGKDEGWIAGALRGPFDGVGMLFARTLAGAYEIVTFPVPVPGNYRPMFRPEYVWESEPPPPPSPERDKG